MRNLIKKILKETEEDPFKWIKDTQPLNYDYLLGKALHFQPHIDNSEDNKRILDYLRTIGFNVGNFLYDHDFRNLHIEGLYLNPKTNMTTWTGDLDDLGEDYGEHISYFAGRPVEVLDGWRTLEGYI